ncbi:MAG TPA: hypothetical protein VGK16_07275 [Candidatus Limnocylindrales bacterium]|jgi:hypothetical protein
MHVNRSLLGWGVFFIVLGAVPLTVRAGVLDAAVVAGAWQLWPLILIGAGLGLVLARSRAAVVGGLVVAVTAGLMAGSLLTNGIGGFGDGFAPCGAGPAGGGTPFAEQRGTFGAAARVSIQLDCGSVEVASAAGSTWNVAGTTRNGRPPDVNSASDRLAIEPASPGTRFGLSSAAGVAWVVTLPQGPRTSFDLTLNAGSAHAAFDAMALDRVTADVNAGSALLDLGNATGTGTLDATVNAGSLAVILPAASVGGSLTANAGSIELCVPDGVDLRIHAGDNPLGSNNYKEAGLVQSGSTWTTPAFGIGQSRIELSTTANLGSITLNPEGGCR